MSDLCLNDRVEIARIIKGNPGANLPALVLLCRRALDKDISAEEVEQVRGMLS